MKRRKGSGPELIILSPETWRLVMTLTALRYEEVKAECEKEGLRLAARFENNPTLDEVIEITKRTHYWLLYWSRWSIDEEEREFCRRSLERAQELNAMLLQKAWKLKARGRTSVATLVGSK